MIVCGMPGFSFYLEASYLSKLVINVIFQSIFVTLRWDIRCLSYYRSNTHWNAAQKEGTRGSGLIRIGCFTFWNTATYFHEAYLPWTTTAALLIYEHLSIFILNGMRGKELAGNLKKMTWPWVYALHKPLNRRSTIRLSHCTLWSTFLDIPHRFQMSTCTVIEQCGLYIFYWMVTFS